MPSPLGKWFAQKTRRHDEPAGYPSNWREISDAYRQRKGYKCEKCGVDCSNEPGLLDTHHIDSNKANTKEENLQALCKLCHAAEPHHQHYTTALKPETKTAILKLRKAQGITIVNSR